MHKHFKYNIFLLFFYKPKFKYSHWFSANTTDSNYFFCKANLNFNDLVYWWWTLEIHKQTVWIHTLPFLTASLDNRTHAWTLADIHRYLKNLWWADQNCPHIVFFIRCSASIKSAAFWNLSLAVTHWNT